MFYTPIKHGFLTNQSARRVLSILYKEIKGFDVYSVKTFNDLYHVFKNVTT